MSPAQLGPAGSVFVQLRVTSLRILSALPASEATSTVLVILVYRQLQKIGIPDRETQASIELAY